ncbi:MAG: discoidin domain-containing protein [Bacteroides sp.]|nr:discoidin domain-containing protein [Bacteroides sp.]
MVKNVRYMIAATGLLACLTGCSDNLETFEVTGSGNAPVAIAQSSVTSEALPGQIKLSWTAPAEGDYDYLQIKYHDPRADEDVCLIASQYTTEMLIDETRARYGDYSFYFQTFNAAHEGSAVTEVKAQSGAAPSTQTEVSRTKVALTASQLSTNAQEPSEGPISNLVDGNVNNFFHTRWSSPQIDLPHYIQINFNEAHEDFAIKYYNRASSNTDGRVTVAELQISNDGENWETVETISGMPTSSGASYTSDFVTPGKSFTYFRFLVTSTSRGKYFHMAEFEFYDVEVEIYDPETME